MRQDKRAAKEKRREEARMREVSNTKYFSSNKRSFFGLFREVGTPILLSVYFLQAAALCLAVSRNFVDKEFR